MGVAACASAPPLPAPPPPQPPGPTVEQRISWILRLEDQRLLRDPALPSPPPAPAPAPVPVRGQKAPVAVIIPPTPPPPDLVRLLGDEEARIRRRAALAVGRIGLAE